MKKTKLLVLSALGLFFVTSCDVKQSDISSIVEKVANADDAIEYVKSLYLNSPASVTGDFERIAEFSLEGFTYNVEWTLTLDAEADPTAVVKGELTDKKQKFTVKFNEDTTKESKFSLTATIKDDKGNDHTVKFDYKVPEFKFNTLTEFMQLADDSSKDTVTVKGKVVAYYKDGPYIANESGEGFYCYSLSGGLSSMKDGGNLWPIGTEVICTGTATKYSGQYEFASGCVVTKKNAAAENFEVSYTDLSNELKDASSNGDKALAKYINSAVELTGITVDACPDASADEKSLYYYFKLGSNKYYFRPYASWYDSKTLTQFTAEQVTAIVNPEDWVKGYTATVRGILGVYNNVYYVSPISSEGSYTITSNVVADEVKAELALEEAATLFGEYFDGTTLTLPANPTGETYKDATYAYEFVGETPEGWTIAGNTLTYNVPAENKLEAQVKVTATVGEKVKEATYKISAFIPQPITVKEFIEISTQDVVETVEKKIKEREKGSIEDAIRNHLRGFTRTIPSFLMAYGDDTVTLATFDDVIPNPVFIEVTSITLDQFRFLRDGGKYTDEKTGEEKVFAGNLFDPVVFDDAVKDFLRLKKKLADYFDEKSVEDIFDYIPPQKTNQIFTPKKMVKKMVDMLEAENPGCFDDPDKTFIDLYMKSGLYITEIVKRLYQSEEMKKHFPVAKERLRHIFEKQVYGLAPTEIIYRIATAYILGFDETIDITKHNFRQFDALPYAKEGTLNKMLDKLFDQSVSV